jgi:hypothetical protein
MEWAAFTAASYISAKFPARKIILISKNEMHDILCSARQSKIQMTAMHHYRPRIVSLATSVPDQLLSQQTIYDQIYRQSFGAIDGAEALFCGVGVL